MKRLRPGQLEVMERVLQGTNTLAVMPTGAGKSLCYQLPAVLLPGTTVVVSPLVALMKDQCDALRALGVSAVQINSAIGSEELAAAREAVESGSARIVLTTPEQIADPALTAALARHPVSLLVVDEAHCISEWGHDFRPAFLEIAPAVKALGGPAVLALTATAKPSVMREIVTLLGIASKDVVQAGAYRPNLRFAVEPLARTADRLPRALDLVAAHEGTGIVYTATVKCAEEVHAKLAAAGESVGLYHGRLNATQRAQAQDDFMEGRVRVMVATNAFGLGIDKPDIRFVLHYQMPASVDAYYQEAGRAGRDGEDATCTLLYVQQDRALQSFFLSGRYPSLNDLQAVMALLHQPAPSGGWTADAIVEAVERPRAKLLVALSLLRSHKVVRRTRAGRFDTVRDLDDAALESLLTGYRARREQDGATLEAMVAYAQGGRCRWQAVLGALGESAAFDTCGHCDNCQRLAALARTAPAAVAPPPQPIEVPPAAPAKPRFAGGETVRAKRYGAGQVVEADMNSVTVEFPNGERRTFLPEFVRVARQARVVAQAGGAHR
ncbi:RecQ family ATP-dependent DNA helicase [Comamonas endophytica]|uniref:RecQ family ATP-dependent DNA helicase n=1 Tax=Comamonas endophytica TaxID=2949090 RepID=UPI003611C74F